MVMGLFAPVDHFVLYNKVVDMQAPLPRNPRALWVEHHIICHCIETDCAKNVAGKVSGGLCYMLDVDREEDEVPRLVCIIIFTANIDTAHIFTALPDGIISTDANIVSTLAAT